MPTQDDLLKSLDESSLSSFHLKTVVTAGMGFFTDAYDLFVIGVVSTILKISWHVTALDISLLNNAAFKLPGTMGIAALIALAGFALPFLLPEPDQMSLETIKKEGEEEDIEAEAHLQRERSE